MIFSPGLVRVLPAGAAAFVPGTARAGVALPNAPYGATRELYKDINPAFVERWAKTTGEKVAVEQSHGGSSKQALAVASGLEADVVTMNQDTDIDLLGGWAKAQQAHFVDGGVYDQIVVNR